MFVVAKLLAPRLSQEKKENFVKWYSCSRSTFSGGKIVLFHLAQNSHRFFQSKGKRSSFGFSGPKNEVDLILSRAAIFSPPLNIHSMTICPSHRAKLGLGWTRGSSTTCRVPSEISNHSKSDKTWPKCNRGIGKGDSQIILKRTGVFLQVGSGKLTPCTFFY